jgi:hypothetical protein
MPIARSLPPTTTIVFDTAELVRLSLVLTSLQRSGHDPDVARLAEIIDTALLATS